LANAIIATARIVVLKWRKKMKIKEMVYTTRICYRTDWRKEEFMKKKPTSLWKYLLAGISMFLLVWGWNFLVAWGAVALAAKCFGFAFA
ncbi:MAG: hypothetical protein NC489_38580, partial [Ruminococcus flavefaciens]|nr:hypothetical protein [Ruminococcus flavefaciens]